MARHHRYSHHVRRAISHAATLAQQYQHPRQDTAHLLVGVMLSEGSIGADVIVGFPAEREAHFDNTVAFLTDLPVSYLHVFTYSERADTAAVNQLTNGSAAEIPRAERKRRNRQLRRIVSAS